MLRTYGLGFWALTATLVAGCADDVGPSPFSGGNEEGGIDPGTTGEIFESTIDPSLPTTDGGGSADGSTDGSSTVAVDDTGSDDDGSGTTDTGADSTTDGADSSSTGAPDVCGDEVVSGDEVCDGSDLGGRDCALQGFDDGTLSCLADCSDFDTRACITFSCGNDAIEGDEACDGADLGGQDCVGLGYDAGTLGCQAGCGDFDESSCVMFSCGNDVIEGMEACDGADLAGQDCLGLGYDAGVLGCAAGCGSFDESGCVMFSCGNDVVEGMEVCDGSDLSGQDCIAQGFDGGVLGCAAGCGAYDTSGCTTFSCGNDVVEGAEICDGADLAGEDCVSQSFDEGVLDCLPGCGAFDTSGCITYVCGNDDIEGSGELLAALPDRLTCDSFGFPGGTLACSATCSSYDTSGCLTELCGNDVAEGTETCDGTDLAGQTCVTQGFDLGSLSCLGGCDGFDTSLCELQTCEEEDIGGATGPAVTTGSTVGGDDDLPLSCANTGGIDHVVQFTAPLDGDYRIDTFGSDYDTALSVFDSCDPLSEILCNDDAATGLQSEVTVTLTAGQTVLLVVDGFNGATGNYVVNIALVGCEEEDIGSAIGSAVASGTTAAEDDDLALSCAGGGGADRIVAFTPPTDGDYTLDTFGSDYDTGLAVFTSCDPASEVDCNDDTGGVQSELLLNLTAGTPVFVAVDGFSGATGNWVLNIQSLACVDADAGSVLGTPAATGSTVGGDDDLTISCALGGGADTVATFTAPASATYVFNTENSAYDTALALFDSCGAGTELACNDDTVGTTSEVTLAMTAGQTVLVVIDGFLGATGAFDLNIIQQ